MSPDPQPPMSASTPLEALAALRDRMTDWLTNDDDQPIERIIEWRDELAAALAGAPPHPPVRCAVDGPDLLLRGRGIQLLVNVEAGETTYSIIVDGEDVQHGTVGAGAPPVAPSEWIARMHVLLAEALRCLENGKLASVRRKVAYADVLLHDLAPPAGGAAEHGKP